MSKYVIFIKDGIVPFQRSSHLQVIQ